MYLPTKDRKTIDNLIASEIYRDLSSRDFDLALHFENAIETVDLDLFPFRIIPFAHRYNQVLQRLLRAGATHVPQPDLIDKLFNSMARAIVTNTHGFNDQMNAYHLLAQWNRLDLDAHDSLFSTIAENVGRIRSHEKLSNVIWSYATLLPLDKPRNTMFVSEWHRRFHAVAKNIDPENFHWGKLIPSAEFLQFGFEDWIDWERHFEAMVERNRDTTTSNFESRVENIFKQMGIDYETQKTISIYRPDFVIYHHGKALAFDCDGATFHYKPNVLRNKVLRMHGLYVAGISDLEFRRMTGTQRIRYFQELLTALEEE